MNPFIIVLLFLFFSGLILFLSGIKMVPENKKAKTISIAFGILLILSTIVVGIIIIIYSLAYY